MLGVLLMLLVLLVMGRPLLLIRVVLGISVLTILSMVSRLGRVCLWLQTMLRIVPKRTLLVWAVLEGWLSMAVGPASVASWWLKTHSRTVVESWNGSRGLERCCCVGRVAV